MSLFSRLFGSNAEHSSPTPPQENDSVLDLYESYLKSKEMDDYDHIHSLRFRHTIERCGEVLSQANNILELGGDSRIGNFAQEALNRRMQEYTDDLRYPFKLPDDQFDLVLALEVLEHIKDSPLRDTDMAWIGHFNLSGLKNIFSEVFRVLRPGGRFIITTPNATSVDVLFKVAKARHPFLYEPHVREFPPHDVFVLAHQHHFERVRFDTFFSWTEADEEFRNRANEFLAAGGFSTEHRGDDAFYEFRKPGSFVAHPPND